MNKPFIRRLIFLLCAAYPAHAAVGLPYELRTHERITANAFKLSDGVGKYLKDVGIDPRDVFDLENRTAATLLADFENTGTPQDWMIEGAIREDDFTSHPGCPQPVNPPSEIDRPLHHFFDVQRGGQGITVLGAELGFPAPDWALGVQGWGPGKTQNQFSVLDARVYQLRSLMEMTRLERDRNTARLFRTLGQVIHMLQDMAQPQHTRNDPHGGCSFPPFLTGERSWYELYIERRALGLRYRERSIPAPPLSLGGYSAPQFSGYRAFFTEPNQRGLADFSSRNFFSAGTNLSLFGSCGGLVEPPCRDDAYTQQDTPFSFTTVDGRTVSGTVRLFLHDVQDRLTGQIIPDVAVTSRSVWDQHLERRGFFPRFSLNTLNYDSMADVLLPRAVGYSAGLLDYFFRGKLDVDLVVDPNDPSIVELSGKYETINGSTDALVDGTLTLYADNPDGTRGQVAGPVEVKNVAPGQEISFQFKPSGEADRFVAVYEGTLGNEMKDPANGFPGGVIGKVLGGVRVESIYPDGDGRLMLRSVDGIFPLPDEAQGLELIQWGDKDNTFVGVRPDPQTGMPQVVAFEINRPLGSPTVPLVAQTDGTEVVSARLLKQASFPSDPPVAPPISLGVTVDYSQTLRFQQRLLTYERNETFVFMPQPEDPNCCYQLQTRAIKAPETFDTPVDVSFPFLQSFQIVLDREHHISQFSPRPYVWRVEKVGLDAQGRLLALVSVGLTSPEDNVRTVKFKKRDSTCSQIIESESIFQRRTLFADFLVGGLLLALIDVEKGEVLGVTASQEVSLSSESADSGFLVQEHVTTTYTGGGPSDGTRAICLDVPRREFKNLDYTDSEKTFEFSTEGALSVSLAGWRRADLEALVPDPITFELVGTRNTVLYFVDDLSRTNHLLHLNTPVRQYGLTVPSETEIMRPVNTTSPEVLLFFRQPGAEVQAQTRFVRWSPQSPANTAPLTEILPPALFHILRSVTSQAALLHVRDLQRHFFSLLIDFANNREQVFPDQFLGFEYILLDPKFLYNLSDLRFHTPDPSLRLTPLPRRLADAPLIFPPEATYHVIRLR